MKFSLIEIANALITLILVAIIAWAKYREKKLSAEHELADNPERCKDHETRLRAVEVIVTRLDERTTDMAGDIEEIKRKLT